MVSFKSQREMAQQCGHDVPVCVNVYYDSYFKNYKWISGRLGSSVR